MSEQNERGSRTGRTAGPHKASHRQEEKIHLRQWSSNDERVQYLIKIIRELNYVRPNYANNDTKVSLSLKIREDIALKFRLTIAKRTIDHILKEEVKKYEKRKKEQNGQVIGDFDRDLEQILEQMKLNEDRKNEIERKKRKRDRRRAVKRAAARQLPREATPVRSFFEGDPLIKQMVDILDARAAVNAAKRDQLLALIETAEAAANYRHAQCLKAHAQCRNAIREIYSLVNQAPSYVSARTQTDVTSPSEN